MSLMPFSLAVETDNIIQGLLLSLLLRLGGILTLPLGLSYAFRTQLACGTPVVLDRLAFRDGRLLSCQLLLPLSRRYHLRPVKDFLVLSDDFPTQLRRQAVEKVPCLVLLPIPVGDISL